jgi:hypothetical protein
MSHFKINTIEEMENLYYGSAGASMIAKADAPVLSSTTGVYNAVYGAQVWSQLNQTANTYGVLPKFSWDRDGWRVITARSASSGGGVAENATLPDTTKPTFVEVSTKAKMMATTFDVSELHQYTSAQSDNDAFGSMEQMRVLEGNTHAELMNVNLSLDNNTLAGNNIESIDRVVGSYSEIAGVGQTAGDLDIYSLDRDAAATWSDSYVNHNSGTDRNLTDALITTTLQNVHENGGDTQVIVTGVDVTKSTLPGLYDEQVRYNALETGVKVSINVNGISTEEGIGAGAHVSTLYGVPVIGDKDIEKDTISRMYFLDTSDPEGYGRPRIGVKIMKPTQYFESGIDVSGDPFAVNRLGNEGLYRTMGELICHFFGAQGKIRDLQ